MANCISKLLNPNTTIIEITSTNPYNGTINNYFDRKYYKFTSAITQEVIFNFQFSGTIVSVEISYYKLVETELQTVGQLFINDPLTNSNLTVDAGEYYFCIASYYPTTYSFNLNFTPYNGILIQNINFYSGDISSAQFSFDTVECNAVIAYRIISGKLPKGLTLRDDGIIEGEVEELDCNKRKDIPSFNNYEDDELTDDETEAYSTTLDFDITVRAYFINAPEIYADRTFTIAVHNNWDFDRDEYLSALENFQHPVFINNSKVNDVSSFVEFTESIEDTLENSLCPCSINTIETEEILTESLCNTCEEDNEESYQIDINELCIMNCEKDIEEEIITTDTEELCVLKCEDEEPLNNIDTNILCPCETPEEIVETIGIELIEDIPNFYLYEFIDRMKSEKVCSGPLIMKSGYTVNIEREEIKEEEFCDACNL